MSNVPAVFEEEDDIQQKIIESENTMLTAFFDLNKNDKEANQFLYTEILKNYVYKKKEKKFKLRERRENRDSQSFLKALFLKPLIDPCL